MLRYRKKWKVVVVMNFIPYACILVAAIFWGTTGTLQTFLIGDISPISIAVVRSFIGGSILLAYVIITKKLRLRKWSWKWTFLAALFIGLFQTAFFTSVQLTGVAIGTVVTIGSAPIFAGLVEWILFKYKPTSTWGIATFLAIIGVCLLFVQTDASIVNIKGVILGLIAGFLFACYTNFSKKLTEQQPTLPAVAMTFTICSLFLMPFGALDGFAWVLEKQNFFVMGIMAIATTTIAYVLFLTGLKKVSSSAAVTLSLAEPLTAALLSVIIVKEHLPVVSWVGVLCILTGIFVITCMKQKT